MLLTDGAERAGEVAQCRVDEGFYFRDGVVPEHQARRPGRWFSSLINYCRFRPHFQEPATRRDPLRRCVDPMRILKSTTSHRLRCGGRYFRGGSVMTVRFPWSRGRVSSGRRCARNGRFLLPSPSLHRDTAKAGRKENEVSSSARRRGEDIHSDPVRERVVRRCAGCFSV